MDYFFLNNNKKRSYIMIIIIIVFVFIMSIIDIAYWTYNVYHTKTHYINAVDILKSTTDDI